MITIKDIARAAGVSHATVSNVLNHKGNVSAKKVKLVQDAARAMGYRINEAAASLRSGSARLMAVILPDVQSDAHCDLFKSLCHTASKYGYGVMLRVTDNIPAMEKASVADILSARAECVVAVSSLPDPAQLYEALVLSGMRVQFALRSVQKSAQYIGFDLAAAARDIAEHIRAHDSLERVGLMTNMLTYPNERAFHDAFLSALADTPVHAVQSIAAQYSKHAFEFFQAGMPTVIVTTCEEMARAVVRVCHTMHWKLPRIYTLGATRSFPSSTYQTYRFDYRLLGKTIGERLLLKINPEHTVLAADAFQKPRVFVQKPAALRMLSIHNPYTDALIRLSPLLKTETGIELSITQKPTAEVTAAYATPAAIRDFDLLRMDMALMDFYAPSLFAPLAHTFGTLEELADEYAMVHGRVYALPFDPSCHLLFYRQDLFENARYRRAYQELYRKPLELPRSYEDYAHTAGFFDSFREETEARGALVSRQTSECLAHLVAICEEGRQPLLTEEMLERYVTTRRKLEASSVIAKGGNWNSIFDRFASGEAVMMIAHSNYAERLSNNPLMHTAGRVGYAPVPGGRPLLGGGVLGIADSSRQKEAALVFIDWLYSDETAALLSLLGGCSPCAAPLENDETLDLYPWLSAVRSGFASGTRRGMFSAGKGRPFHQLQREERVASICRQAVDGAMEVKEAVEAIVRMDGGLGEG